MSRIGAYTPATARRVLDAVNDYTATRAPRKPQQTYQAVQQGLMYKTPSGGIPAMSGTMPGTADCTQQLFDESDNVIDLIGDDGNPRTDKVYNVFGSPIAGDTTILVLWMYGRRVAHAEDCPA